MPRHELEFRDEKSAKFWHIELQGCAHTVRYGRIGTTGQSKTKEFSDQREAEKSYQKLLASKLKKGYRELAVLQTEEAQPEPIAETEPEAPPETLEQSATQATDPPRVSPESTIDLDPEDLLWRTEEVRKKRVRPEALPFDRELRLSQLADDEALIEDIMPENMTPEEARFWIYAVDWSSRGRLAELDFSEELSFEQFQKLHSRCIPQLELLLRPATILFPYKDILMHLFKSKVYISVSLFHRGLRRGLLCYLSEAEFDELKEQIRAQVDPAKVTQPRNDLPGIYHFAAALGCHQEVETMLDGLPDNTWPLVHGARTCRLTVPQGLIMALDQPEKMARTMRRFKLNLPDPHLTRAWLVLTGTQHLDFVVERILEHTSSEGALPFMQEFLRVHAPEAAPGMLELRLHSRLRKLAADWLYSHPEFAIEGLVPVAAGRSKMAPDALDFLKEMKARGFADLVNHHAHAIPKLQKNLVDWEPLALPQLTGNPAWLEQSKSSSLPDWGELQHLPPIESQGAVLNPEQVRALLSSLAQERVDPSIREHCTQGSLDAFAWKLFRTWMDEGAPAKLSWCLYAIGHIGSDDLAVRLTPLIRRWPGEAQHQRAVKGLETLRKLGSHVALMEINGVAQKVKFKGIKARAQDLMSEIAADLGLSKGELEDRIVPDCGLDPQGTRVFDFGPRQFKFVLGAKMKPMVCDDKGKLKANLPKPGKSDDPDLAQAATAQWKVLKKQLRDVLKLQPPRLERAMVAGRRWTVEEFQQFFLHHPLMINITRNLVWGVFCDQELISSFRVTEEQDLADVNDDTFSLEEGQVGLVHPLELPGDLAARWGELLSDYEILTPFPQLDRPTYAVEKAEFEETQLKRWANLKFNSAALYGTLNRLDWTPGSAEDHGMVMEHTKSFPAYGVTAVVSYQDGVPRGMIEGWDDQTVTGACFLKSPASFGSTPLKLVDVPATVFSEVVKELEEMSSSALVAT